jgi:serine/threonine-protein kinase ULK/ATG1
MLGSPLQMAPEVLEGRKYNSKADVWSLGVIIYELLFGFTPHHANNMQDLLRKIKTRPINFPQN